ncbi:hypothetical protein LJR231_000235 [Phyllobacterium sp. LjRoot231]|uniref:hypothetical protein n=1 Tax=Phyllobacterium sp. LjRoot231 TaxID=3342289 RepID=UPI003ED0C3F8
MRNYYLSIAALMTISTALIGTVPANAGERLGFPPPDPPGTVRPKMTAETIRQDLDQQLKNRFTAASGGSGRLTAQQAKDAGWGFIADHFGEITGGNADSVSLDEIQTFIDARSLGNPAGIRAKAKAATTTFHKVE